MKKAQGQMQLTNRRKQIKQTFSLRFLGDMLVESHEDVYRAMEDLRKFYNIPEDKSCKF